MADRPRLVDLEAERKAFATVGDDFRVCDHPVFVIGSPGAESNLLAWALAQHDALWTSVESDFLHHLLGQGHVDQAFQRSMGRSDGDWLTVNAVDRAEFLSFVGLGINALFTSRSGNRTWIEQSPTYTLMADVLSDLFPGARFIHVVRDGRAVVEGMLRSQSAEHWASEFPEACHAWAHFVTKGLDLEARNPTRVRSVDHEELRADPAPVLRDLFEFLDLPDEPAASTYLRGVFTDAEVVAPHEALDAVTAWEHWTPEQRAIFWKDAAPVLFRSGLAAPADLIGSGALSEYREIRGSSA